VRALLAEMEVTDRLILLNLLCLKAVIFGASIFTQGGGDCLLGTPS
jgi:hypothetical protein